jgi:hypothetical protein
MGTLLSGPTTFAWTAGAGPSEYVLRVGTGGPGTGDLYSKVVSGKVNSVSGVNVPANGSDVYVEFLYRLNDVWTAADYTFREAGSPTPPALTAPVAGTLLIGATTFTWSPGAGLTYFELRVGTNGPGSTDLFVEAVPNTVTSISGVNIPANGKNVYVQLQYLFNGVWTPIDYTFMEAAK